MQEVRGGRLSAVFEDRGGDDEGQEYHLLPAPYEAEVGQGGGGVRESRRGQQTTHAAPASAIAPPVRSLRRNGSWRFANRPYAVVKWAVVFCVRCALVGRLANRPSGFWGGGVHGRSLSGVIGRSRTRIPVAW